MAKLRKRRWTIVYPKTGQYTSDATGRTKGIGWTNDVKLAQKLCSQGGVVVDADWLAHNWDVIVRTKAVPPEAMPGRGETDG